MNAEVEGLGHLMDTVEGVGGWDSMHCRQLLFIYFVPFLVSSIWLVVQKALYHILAS